ncbi:MAG: carbohydrate-binding domain-containing protein [Lachnospiraceae bacterium]|nr:carbohydrate-binding domain-containing protein [Lachnospiraceae bacterium]
MSTSKYFDRICVIVTVIALIITTLYMFGEKLGIRKIVDEDSEGYEAPSGFTDNDLNSDWDDSDATVITLNGDSAEISGDGAYQNDGNVVIANAGKYVVSGTLSDGSIVVDAYDSSKVFIRLAGVSVYCSNDAAFRVNQADKVFLTLAEGTDNSFESGSEYSESALSDNTGGTFFSHDDLTVNGNGSLTITAAYKHGIDCNDKLVIAGGNITINAPQDGIHANDGVNIINATLTINAEDDGINGGESVLVAGGTINILGCYEGIEAVTVEIRDGELSIECTDDGINANGGSGGFGGMPGGMSGNFRGGMQSNPNTDFEPGAEPPEDFKQKRLGQGEFPQPPEDGSDNENENAEETWIHISGGNITILNSSGRDSDGLDSNGDIIITGGNILISLTGSGGNNAIDYGSESGGVCEISGGSVIACGSSSMAEAFSSTSTQGAILYMFSEEAEAGTPVTVSDSEGNNILSWEVPYSYSAVTISHPSMTVGNDYTIAVGESSETITLDEIATTYGEASQGGIGGMGRGGFKGSKTVTTDSSDESVK